MLFLLMFLHGAGERGSDLQLVKKHGPPKMIEAGETFPFIVVSPQCPLGAWWPEDVVIAVLDEIVEKYRVDKSRIYLTGLSMGGYGTWKVAQTIPDRLAAIVPICGGGDPSNMEAMKDLSVWAFHGAQDKVVDLSESAAMVNALYDIGNGARFSVYPQAGHAEAWEEAYADAAMWKWLQAQQRSDRLQ